MNFLNPIPKKPKDKALIGFIYSETVIYLILIFSVLIFLLQNSFHLGFQYALNYLFLYYLFFGFFTLPIFLAVSNIIYCVIFSRRKKTDFLLILIYRVLLILTIFVMLFSYYNRTINHYIGNTFFTFFPIFCFFNFVSSIWQIYRLK